MIFQHFSIEDGQKGLDELIEFSDYIALSIPELRIIKKKEYTYQLASYIKNKKPSIDIHLLGCTEYDMLKKCNFCSSSDSTSWLSVVRYGAFDLLNGKKKLKNVNKELLSSKYYDVLKIMSKKYNIILSEKKIDYFSTLIFQAEQLKQKYALHAGPQD